MVPNNYQILSEIDEFVAEVGKRNPRRILEIGTLEGYTLFRWSEAIPRGATIVSVDLLVPDSDPRFSIQRAGQTGGWWRMTNHFGQAFCLLSGNSRDVEVISSAAAHGPYDFIFIDGDHSYDGVRSDWENYFPMLAKGGLLAFHDIAVNEPWSGVFQLWNEIKSNYRYREILHCPNGTRGIGVIDTSDL